MRTTEIILKRGLCLALSLTVSGLHASVAHAIDDLLPSIADNPVIGGPSTGSPPPPPPSGGNSPGLFPRPMKPGNEDVPGGGFGNPDPGGGLSPLPGGGSILDPLPLPGGGVWQPPVNPGGGGVWQPPGNNGQWQPPINPGPWQQPGGTNRPYCPQYNNGQRYNDTGNGPSICIAAVPPEYDCPLFENRPYDALNMAIDSLTASMTTVPECAEQKSSMETVQRNNEAIKTAVTTLQGFMQNPDTAYANMGQLQSSIQTAIQSTSNLGQIFTNNSFTQSRCGRQVMGAGKALLALNDILNNLAPYALMAVAINPGIGMAAKFAITGGAVATSAIATVVDMVQQGSIDMTNPNHRMAVLKNTCQYTKIARKVRFMQLAQSGQIQKITAELDKQVAIYREKMNQKAGELDQILQYKQSIERQASIVEDRIRKDNFEISALEMQFQEARNDDLYICLMSQDLVRRSASNNATMFPMTVRLNLEQAMTVSQAQQTTQLLGLLTINDTSRRRISAYENAVQKEDGAAIKLCADTARTWISTLKQMVKVTAQLVNEERAQVEAELSTNPEYVAWRDQYVRLQTEQQTVNRVTRVMSELAKDNSVIDRSELDQRMALLRGSLFGVRGSWTLGHSPIYSWLDYTMGLHRNRVSSFIENIKLLQRAAYQLSKTGRGGLERGQATWVQDVQTLNDFAASGRLETITKANIPIGSPGQELACQMLESAWIDWSGAIDHLGASQFMCDMVYGYLDNKVEKGLISFCRGDVTLDGRQLVKSELQKAKGRLTAEKALTGLSYKQWSVKLNEKMKELECPMPPVSDMSL